MTKTTFSGVAKVKDLRDTHYCHDSGPRWEAGMDKRAARESDLLLNNVPSLHQTDPAVNGLIVYRGGLAVMTEETLHELMRNGERRKSVRQLLNRRVEASHG